jgi:hypothetical protein
MEMLLFTLFKTQLTLTAASSLMFLSSVRQVQMAGEAQEELFLEIEIDEIAPEPLLIKPQKKEEE